MGNKLVVLVTVVIVLAIVIVSVAKFGRPGRIVSQKDRVLTDEELLEYAQSSFDKKEMMFKDMIIGTHNGTSVRVTFPCADLCPDYTTRVMRYDVDVSQCASVGGAVKALYVPIAAGLANQTFCFPKILTENNVYPFFGE